MEQETHKLTGRLRARYDRTMPEAATETLEKDQVRDAWAQQLAEASDPATRSAIQAAINMGYTPADIPGEVEDLTKEYVDKEFEDLKDREDRERKKREKSPRELEMLADEYINKVKEQNKGASQAPGEVLRKDDEVWTFKDEEVEADPSKKDKLKDEITTDWSEYGWDKESVNEVARKLDGLLTGSDKLSANQTRNIMEMLVATGRTGEEAVQILEANPFPQPDPDDVAKMGRERAMKELKRIYFSNLGIREDYIMRFIFPVEFHAENERDYQQDDPSNMEEVAWQIMHSPGGTYAKFGPNGTYPVLEMRIDKTKNKEGKTVGKGKYYINQSNMVQWARDRMWYNYDLNPQAGQNYFESVAMDKPYKSVTLGGMFVNPQRYFKSEDGETDYYGDLCIAWITEAWSASTLRTWDSEYQKKMHDPTKLMETLQSIFTENTFTKSTFKKNLFSLMAKMPLNFEGTKKGELPRGDNIMGACWNDMFQAYYNLSDFDELQRIWGKGSSFFTEKGFITAFKAVLKDKALDASGENMARALAADGLHKNFEKAFDGNGQITTEGNKQNFIQLISDFLAKKMNNPNIEETLRVMMKNAAAERYGARVKTKDENNEVVEKYALVTKQGKEDDMSLKMAEIFAFSMIRVFGGGARNDTTASGYDYFNKMHYFQTYRDKMVNKNGDAAGNPYTIPQFKMLAVDAPNAITTISEKIIGYKPKKDANGNVIGQEPIYQSKTILEVMKEMGELTAGYTLRLKQLEEDIKDTPKGPEKTRKKEELERFKKEMDQTIQNKAAEYEFTQRSFSNYYDDHVMRAQKTWELIMKAKEVEMEKYVQYDAWGGVSFQREKFQEDVQDNMIHHIRYFINTYPDLNYNMTIRTMDQVATIRNANKKPPEGPVFREMALGEAMFGHELLNREQFWLRDENGKPINMRKNGRKMKGMYEIDYDKVNENKVLLWKQWFATKLAADLWSHRAFHSSDNRFDLNYYNSVIKAIESLPGALHADEYNLRQQAVSKNFFDKGDMQWFKKICKTENYDLFVRAFFKDMLLPDERQEGIGLLLALSLATRAIVKQGG